MCLDLLNFIAMYQVLFFDKKSERYVCSSVRGSLGFCRGYAYAYMFDTGNVAITTPAYRQYN